MCIAHARVPIDAPTHRVTARAAVWRRWRPAGVDRCDCEVVVGERAGLLDIGRNIKLISTVRRICLTTV